MKAEAVLPNTCENKVEMCSEHCEVAMHNSFSKVTAAWDMYARIPYVLILSFCFIKLVVALLSLCLVWHSINTAMKFHEFNRVSRDNASWMVAQMFYVVT